MSSDDVLVSVLIPSYNHERYIKKTIDSVLSQTYKNIEVLVGDDLSTDNTRKILTEINDTRLKCFMYTSKHGVEESLNYLISQAKGEYLCCLGSDDSFMPEKIEKQLEEFRRDPSLGAVFTLPQPIDENDVPYDDDSDVAVLFNVDNRSQEEWIRFLFDTGNRFCHPSVMIPSGVQKEIGNYRCVYRQLHDFDMWSRLLCKYPVKIIQERLTLYRWIRDNKSSLSAPTRENHIRTCNEYSKIIQGLFESIPQSLFEAAFSDQIQSPKPLSETQFAIERFTILKNLTVMGFQVREAAVNFFINCVEPVLDKDEVLPIRQQLLSNYYDLTGNNLVDCPDEMRRLEEENRIINKENRLLNSTVSQMREQLDQSKNELEAIYRSRGWKMVLILRKIKGKLSGKRD